MSPTYHHLSIHSRSRSWSKDFKNVSRKWERDGGKWEKSQLRVHFLPGWESYQGGHAFKGRNRGLNQRMNLKERNSTLESSQVFSFRILFPNSLSFHLFSNLSHLFNFPFKKKLVYQLFPSWMESQQAAAPGAHGGMKRSLLQLWYFDTFDTFGELRMGMVKIEIYVIPGCHDV